MTYLLGLGFTLLTACLVIAGDVLLKYAAGRTEGAAAMVAFGCAIYAVSGLGWFMAMKHATLSQAGVAYGMFTLIALALIGDIWFRETLSMREYAGVGLAVVSIVLMSRLA